MPPVTAASSSDFVSPAASAESAHHSVPEDQSGRDSKIVLGDGVAHRDVVDHQLGLSKTVPEVVSLEDSPRQPLVDPAVNPAPDAIGEPGVGLIKAYPAYRAELAVADGPNQSVEEDF